MQTLPIALVLGMLVPAAISRAEPADYFVAVDGLATLPSGTFAGLPNPNFGRLTLLVAHRFAEDPTDNHFHAIGAYTYASLEGGPPFIISTSTNNRIPELSTGFLPLRLHPGAGLHRRHFVSLPTEAEYSNLRIASIQSLADLPPDSPDGILFRSSGMRWSSRLDGAHVALQRVSLTPGLHASDQRGRPILLERLLKLGNGNTLALFPTYWTHRLAPVGTYSATLKLVDLRPAEQRFGDSGRFTFDFRVPKRGDLDGDNDVDRDDLHVLEAGLGEAASGVDDARDLNADRRINGIDRRILLHLLATDDEEEDDDD
jgi:hypothetical protein